MGLFRISMKDYQAAPGLSRSYLCKLLDSPAHAEWARTHPDEPTEAMVLGSAIHTAVFEPHLWDKEFVVSDFSKRTKDGKQLAATYASMGMRCLSVEQNARVQGMREAVVAHSVAANLFSGGKEELSVFWEDPETGSKCKARPDYLRRDGIVVDLKSCADAGPRAFQRTAWENGYAVQAAYYLAGLNAIGIAATQFVFVAVESQPPYAVAVYAADADFISLGTDKYKSALNIYKKCRDEGKFPGYPETVQPLSPPKWAFYE